MDKSFFVLLFFFILCGVIVVVSRSNKCCIYDEKECRYAVYIFICVLFRAFSSRWVIKCKQTHIYMGVH